MVSHNHAGHDHAGHSHTNHGHQHLSAAAKGRAFSLGLAINFSYLVVEIIAGLASHSLALLADAAHNASDVAGLFGAWIAGRLALRAANASFTYGFGRASILAALGNAVALLLVTGGIAWEAFLRLLAPPEVAGGTVMLVAAAGILVNGGSALLFLRGQHDLNIRGAFLHLAGDAGLAGATVLAGIVIFFTRWYLADPIVSLLVAGLMIWSTWSLLRQSVALAMDRVPEGLDTETISTSLARLPGVVSVHDLHVWPISTTEAALTAHLVRTDATAYAELEASDRY